MCYTGMGDFGCSYGKDLRCFESDLAALVLLKSHLMVSSETGSLWLDDEVPQ